ncbi:unnamed protein product, partial [Rotaria magnacalcarata]
KLGDYQCNLSAWNFEHRILFDKTDYISQIYNDSIQMLSTLHEFYDIFRLEMKTITDEEHMGDRVLEHITEF